MKDYCVELKVCEGCGALYLRAARQGLSLVQGGQRAGGEEAPKQGRKPLGMCRSCVAIFREFPAVKEPRRRCVARGVKTVQTAGLVGGAR
jgi:hypothetical protein